jgi:hypothetical protein
MLLQGLLGITDRIQFLYKILHVFQVRKLAVCLVTQTVSMDLRFKIICKKNMKSETQSIQRGFCSHLENADMNVNAPVHMRCVPKAKLDRRI